MGPSRGLDAVSCSPIQPPECPNTSDLPLCRKIGIGLGADLLVIAQRFSFFVALLQHKTQVETGFIQAPSRVQQTAQLAFRLLELVQLQIQQCQ